MDWGWRCHIRRQPDAGRDNEQGEAEHQHYEGHQQGSTARGHGPKDDSVQFGLSTAWLRGTGRGRCPKSPFAPQPSRAQEAALEAGRALPEEAHC